MGFGCVEHIAAARTRIDMTCVENVEDTDKGIWATWVAAAVVDTTATAP